MRKTVIFITLLLLISSKHYAQWFPVNPYTGGYYTTIQFRDTLNGWLGGIHDDFFVIFKTTDGSVTWDRFNLSPVSFYGPTPNSIAFANKDTGYCVTDSGYIYKTTNSGADWNIVYTDLVDLHNIFFLNKNDGWIVGADGLGGSGVLLSTSDGGGSWNRSVFQGLKNFRTIEFLDNSTGIIGGGWPAKIYKTTDAGNTWFTLFEPNSTQFSGFHSISITDTIWYAAATDLFISEDSGNSWEQKGLPGFEYSSLWGIGNRCWAVVNQHILYSFDYGNTWVPVFRDSPLNGVYFINKDNGYAYGFNLNKTVTGGIDTITIPNTPQQSSPVNGGTNIPTDLAFVWSDQNYSFFRLQVSKDSLLSGTEIDTLIIDWRISVSIDEHTTYYWRVRAENYLGNSDWSPIWYFTTGLHVNVNEEKILEEFRLSQNFPNPFNPTTAIKYQIPELSFVTIKVYDALGNEIATLVNEEKSAGEYDVEFDGTDLTSGIYFYRIEAGSFIETKKMILIK
ncbi:MAG: T9SS type A sorting domain-containing protein [Ignavibacteria bacterium]|nr:T9SS type A sorting domain-containing protein [Ignavibacteria bacterium]